MSTITLTDEQFEKVVAELDALKERMLASFPEIDAALRTARHL